MIHADIERFLGTLLYPLSDPNLIFQDPLEEFIQALPEGFIEPQHLDMIKRKRKQVYDKAIQYMQVQCQLDNYDQIQQYMERWYLGQDVWRVLERKLSPDSLSVYKLIMHQLKRLADSMISKLDGKFIYKYWETKGDSQLLGGFSGQDKIHLFRGLTQLMPLDLLVVLSVLDSNQPQDSIRAFQGDIAVTDSPLEQILQKGIAENHLHMGVSAGFPMIWEELMSSDVRFAQQVTHKGLPICEQPSVSTVQLCFYWAYARYLRFTIASLICCPQKDDHLTTIDYFIGTIFDHTPSLKERVEMLLDSKQLQSILYTLKKIDDVIDFFSELDDHLITYVQETPSLKFLHITENVNSEGLFLLRVMERLKESHIGKEDTCIIESLFLRYLRLKHGIFRMMVQHKAVGGLDYFQRYYTSMSHTSSFSEQFASASSHKSQQLVHYKRLILAQLSNPYIKKVEFRTSFFDTEAEARSNIRAFLIAYQEILQQYYCERTANEYQPKLSFPKVGLVLHFLKSLQEMPDLCVYGDEDSLLQYQEIKQRYQKQLEIFLNLRNPQKYPGIDHYLVGIDVASLENEVPTWVFVSVYEAARDSKKEPFFLTGQVPYQSLGFTCHAGEDFRHLISGLRRIYETVHYLKFHAGDRIGHGLALGINIDDWYQKHPNVVLPRIEALENYLWAYKMLSTYPSSSNSSDLLYLEQRIHCLSGEIFQCKYSGTAESIHISTSVLLQSYERLFEDFEVSLFCQRCQSEESQDCSLKELKITNSTEVLKAYHCNHFVPNMKQVIHYHLSPQEVAVMKTLQKLMQEFISRAGVVVEINPSSNVIIGPMDTLHQHPLYAISSYQCDYKDLMVCVNSDDPGVFQTNTSNELGIAYMGMVERGIGREACLSWVDRLRENGMRSSFIRNTDSDQQILQTLENLIELL